MRSIDKLYFPIRRSVTVELGVVAKAKSGNDGRGTDLSKGLEKR